jgi:hypothetical protein
LQQNRQIITSRFDFSGNWKYNYNIKINFTMKKPFLILSVLAIIASSCNQTAKQQTAEEEVTSLTSSLRPDEFNLQMGIIYTDTFEFTGIFYDDEYTYYQLKLENDYRNELLIRNRVKDEPRLNVGDKLEIQWIIDSIMITGAGGIGDWAVNVKKLSSAPANEILQGRYRNSTEISCDIFLVIDKSNEEYTYTLLINDSEFNGKVTVSDNGITLEGIAWASNNEVIDGKKIEPSFGVYFEFENGGLTMQNYGNAMNYYQVFDCQDKYITLKKE